MKRKTGYWRMMTGLAMALACGPGVGRADVLLGVNGERFVGQVIEEQADIVVFQSELGGRLTVPRNRIREIQRTPPAAAPSRPPLALAAPATNAPALPRAAAVSTNLLWQPPVLGYDKADWIQLKSGEWLRGQLKYVQQKQVEFDSDELEQLTFKLKNVRQIYPAEPFWVKSEGREPVFGSVILSNEVLSVSGAQPLRVPRDEILGITPAGFKGIRDWSGKFTVGLNLQSGNNQLATLSTSGELTRRTPNTRLGLDYLGNFSEVNGDENANNQRVSAAYDIRLSHHWFVRPVQLEYFHDPVANISSRVTAGLGGGYYIFDRTGLEWNLSAGPAYQYTRFDTVEAGQNESTTTPSGILQSTFKVDITPRLDLAFTYRGTFTSEEAGLYTHHTVSTLSFEIKRHLDLDLSFIWDYLQNPQPEADGTLPHRSDYYLTLGLGVRF